MINSIINNNNTQLVSPAFSYFVLKTMLVIYCVSDDLTEETFNNLFVHNKNFNKIIKKFIKLNESSFYDFKSCRMTFFELE